MATAASILEANIATAQAFTEAAGQAVANIAVPAHSIGYSILGTENLGFKASGFATASDTSPMPVYHEPTITMPSNPNLVSLHKFNAPVIPAPPSVSTAGLFQHKLPAGNLPQFTATRPHLHADEIYNALATVLFPVLDKITLPTITPLTIGTLPKVTLPGYNAVPPPSGLTTPADYAQYYQQQYDRALPAVRRFVDDTVANFVNQFAPDFYILRDQLSAAIRQELAGGELPYEAALYARHQARIDREITRAESGVVNSSKYRGWLVPPGAQQDELQTVRVEALRSLAGASTDVFIEISRQRLQMRQFILQMADGQVNSVRNQALQFAQLALSVQESARAHAQALASLLITKFEHERSRAEFDLALMRALDDRFKVQLEAAMSALTVYEAELRALGLRADIEAKKLDEAKVKVEVQKLQVDTYSAIIDAIAKRAIGDELKIKEMELQVRLFETEVKGVLAGYDAFKAAIEGDKAKVEGELAKQEVYNSQIKAIGLQVDAHKAVQEGDIQTNQANMAVFTSRLGAYETAAKIALQRFSAEAEVKKLKMEDAKTRNEINLAAFRGQLQRDSAYADAVIEVFKGNVASLTSYYGLQRDWAQLYLHAQSAVASGYTNVAAAAIQSTNAVASVAE